jgi:hypothetical protein
MAEQRVKKKRTLVKFYVQESEYVAGRGAVTEWKPITVCIGHDESGAEITTDCFWCEWMGSWGSVSIQQQADGVHQAARVRLPFVQKLYDALTARDVRIYKNGVIDEAHRFSLASSANNYQEQNQMLEFQVKKHEVR